MKRTSILIALFVAAMVFGVAGHVDAEVFAGYNLYTPINSTETYLVDNDGGVVHSWSSDFRPGQSVYLLEDSTLLRTAHTGNAQLDAGGAGGRVEMIAWDGTVTWSFDYVPYGYYFGNAPQGDAIRIDNYARCVRDAPQDIAPIFRDDFETGDIAAWQ